MTQPKQPPRTGKPLALTPEEIDQAAIVTPVDVAVAAATWQFALKGTNHERLGSLLDDGPFTFNQATGQYETTHGSVVRASAVRAALDAVIEQQAAAVRLHTQWLVDGNNLSLAAWTTSMLSSIKAIHLISTAAAVGGLGQTDPFWKGWTADQIKPQYNWLLKFSVEIGNGQQPLDGTAVARSALYAQAARSTHREAQRLLAAQRAVGEERRVLGQADHCRDCLQQAALGWQPFGTLKRIGDSACRSNCRCWFEFQATPTAIAA